MTDKKKPKLHEILAVESDLQATALKIVEEAKTTFSKKHDHFLGYHKTLVMFDESRRNEEAGAEDMKKIVETVPGKLKYIRKPCERWFDALLQKESTNQNAKADLVVDGAVVASDLPATWFLGMESRLKALRLMYEAIPTQAPGVAWVPDNKSGEGIFISEFAEKKDKTDKAIRHKVIVPPTEHHPAQVESWSDNEKVGVFVNQKWTSMITSAEKSEKLDRIDRLIRAMKQARQRANQAEVVTTRVAKKLFDYIDG